jgi:hypothetical protein
MVHPEDVEDMMTNYKTSTETKTLYSMEKRILLPDGKTIWTFCQGFPQYFDHGDVVWNA